MKLKVKPGDREGIEDRRLVEPVVPPSAPDALLRGLPQTPHEWELYRQRIAAAEAVKQGVPIPPQPQPLIPGLIVPNNAGPGDPAGLESRRSAIMERIKADQAALDELDSRLDSIRRSATWKGSKP